MTVVSPASAAVKSGSACPTLGKVSISAGKKYTCIKSGKRLVWDKGVTQALTPGKQDAAPSPVQSSAAEPAKFDYSKTFSTDSGYLTEFSGPCDKDPNVSGLANEIQQYYWNINYCAGQIRINKYSLGSKRPTVQFNSASNFSNTQPCKLVTPSNSRSNLGFTTSEPGRNQWAEKRKYPSPNTVIQLVPIYADDTAKPKNSPAEDYAYFLNYFKNWIEYSSDFGSNVEVRIPSKYIKMNSNIGDFQVYHTKRHDDPEHVAFNKAVVAATDSEINYSGANIAIVVPPAGTDAKVLGQASIGALQTADGEVPVVMSEFAAFATNPQSQKYSLLGAPFWWVHEIFHAGYGFDDHYGDTAQNINSEYGMGSLTLLTPYGGDLTTWEKWIMGFMQDSQIQCVSSGTSSTHWIVPSTVKTTESKAIVVKVSDTKVVVVETLRPAGLYYKLPQQGQGALVYEIDLMKDTHGMGMKLSLPLGRKVESTQYQFMASYPLKEGESTICDGYKFTIVESGTFGDVVKVEKQ